MKKIKLLAILFFGALSHAQNTVDFNSTATPSIQNALFGAGAGASLQPLPGSYSNTFIGLGSGAASNGSLGVGEAARNTFIGFGAGSNNTGGSDNVYVGQGAGSYFTTGEQNVSIKSQRDYTPRPPSTGDYNTMTGSRSGDSMTTGDSNSFYGFYAGASNTSGTSNTCLGDHAGISNVKGNFNVFAGYIAGSTNSSGDRNVMIGNNCGRNNVAGSDNTLLGAVNLLGDVNRTIILADGLTNQRLYFDRNGFGGVGLGSNVIPQNTFEIRALAGSPSQAGLRLTSLPNTSAAIVNPTNSVLSVDGAGDVILVQDIGGGVTSTCTAINFVPVTSGTDTLACSQIYDNSGTTPIASASVGINSSGPFGYTSLAGFELGTTVPPTLGNFRLDVNGVTRSVAFFASSDNKFKKDVKPIVDALSEIQKLSGKTYHWKREEFKDMDFNDQLQFGFIAQELGVVFPSLVVKSDKGDYSVNYLGLIPVLVEAIKTQQTQIDDLKSQITENFKNENTELINLQNTKIISVSPNPSSSQIVVSLNIEKSVTTAKLQVHDLNGNVIGSFNITERDNNISKTLLKDNYGKGIYVVSLVVNGKSIDTKKIVFN